MKKKLLSFLLMICTAVFVFCGWQLYRYYHAYRQAEQEYEEVKEGAGSRENGREIDFKSLQKTNQDVIGWICADGTSIDYPIVKSHDNEEYLSRTFQGTSNRSGAIFMDKNCSSDFESDNNVIYGHHMRDGSMFADLLDFRDASFLKEHHQIMVYTPEKDLKLEVISAYPASGDTLIPVTFASEDEKRSYISEILEKSDVSANVSVEDQKKIGKLYTFVTCSYEEENNRTFVHAVESDDMT